MVTASVLRDLNSFALNSTLTARIAVGKTAMPE